MKRQDKEQKKDVILIGEEHQNGAHMPHVTLLVKNKLDTYSNVVVALEQNCGTKTLDDFNKKQQPDTEARTSPRLQKKAEKKSQDPIVEQIEKFVREEMVFDKDAEKFKYTQSLTDIAKYAIETKKTVSFIGVDTQDALPAVNIKRDEAMFKGIKKALKTSDCLVYPVGSAHIHNYEVPEEMRLGSLLLSDNGINLKIGNFYKKDSEAYKTVDKDITAFKTHHKLLNFEVLNPPLTNSKAEKETSVEQPTERKLKSNVIPKKPLKINKQSDKLELNIETEFQEKLLERKLSQEDITTKTGPPTKILKKKHPTDITTEPMEEAKEEAKKIRKDFKLEKYSPDVQKSISLKRKTSSVEDGKKTSLHITLKDIPSTFNR